MHQITCVIKIPTYPVSRDMWVCKAGNGIRTRNKTLEEFCDTLSPCPRGWPNFIINP
jgi:hypothetical protein